MADGNGPLMSHTFRVRALFISDLHLGTRDCHAGRPVDNVISSVMIIQPPTGLCPTMQGG